VSNYLLACIAVFIFFYSISLLYITIFYHRCLAHRALVLHPVFEKFLWKTSCWVTGIEPKAWVCMHRLHHRHSDTQKDPHSPAHSGFFKLFISQSLYYEEILKKIRNYDPETLEEIADIDYPLHPLHQKEGFVWLTPYFLHGAIALSIALSTGLWAISLCYYFGLTAHPFQGWAVNSFGHAIGYRNFALPDQSTNNSFVAYAVMGEGFQNNHHRYPDSPKFSVKPYEFDIGYMFCLILRTIKLADFDTPKLGQEKLDTHKEMS